MKRCFEWWLLRRARKAASNGRWRQASDAYGRLLRLRPGYAAGWIQHGHALKESLDFVGAEGAYQRATEVEPKNADAWFQLAHARRLLGDRPGSIAGLVRATRADPGFAPAVEALIGQGERDRLPAATQRFFETADPPIFARDAIQAWRKGYVIPPAPTAAPRAITIVADATALRDATLPGPSLLLLPGTVLDRAALDWFAFALDRTPADIVYCDHVAGGRRAWLQPMPDPLWFADPATMPPALLVRGDLRIDDDAHSLLLAAVADGRAAHLPIPLASTLEAPDDAAIGSTSACPDTSGVMIQVVIQTRDRAELLEPCVRSLRDTALRPDLLDVTIVDNRSVETETATLLARWQAEGAARVLPYDAPFNWSRANNVAAASGKAPLLLFLNNDTETETVGWDEHLRRALVEPETGAIGALLLYPDRTIQHAGIVMGMNRGDPIHEGIARAPHDGPMGRWRRRRSVPAVTGAWIAMRREVFESAGRFDEALAVAFNDVDLCLAIRAGGRRIVFDPALVALHRESMTRGSFLDAEALIRDRAEFEQLLARWGTFLRIDPGYNPGWVHDGQPFDGLRLPNSIEIIDWLDRSAASAPWAVAAPLTAKAPVP